MKMKEKIHKWISLLIGNRAVGRMEQMRLMSFLLGAALGLIGMPFHFFFTGWALAYRSCVLYPLPSG